MLHLSTPHHLINMLNVDHKDCTNYVTIAFLKTCPPENFCVTDNDTYQSVSLYSPISLCVLYLHNSKC